MSNNNQTIRYLVTIGIFNALLIGIFILMGFTIGLIPLVLIFLPILVAIPGGIIFMLMVAKAPMPGIFIISGTMLSLFFLNMAPAGIFAISIFLGGVLGEIMVMLMGREKFIGIATGFACYMLGFAVGEGVPFVFMKEAYIAQEASKGTEQLGILQGCLALMNPTMLIIICLLTIVVSYVSSIWGRHLLRTHFKKAGIV